MISSNIIKMLYFKCISCANEFLLCLRRSFEHLFSLFLRDLCTYTHAVLCRIWNVHEINFTPPYTYRFVCNRAVYNTLTISLESVGREARQNTCVCVCVRVTVAECDENHKSNIMIIKNSNTI
jgi:hypothetical protein